MTNEEAIKIIETEKACVLRNVEGCDRRCSVCALCLVDEDIIKAYDMAIEALEKQMPKKPFNDRLTTRKFCPSCKKKLRIFIDRENDFFGGYERVSLHSNCCEECGQALDWSEA